MLKTAGLETHTRSVHHRSVVGLAVRGVHIAGNGMPRCRVPSSCRAGRRRSFHRSLIVDVEVTTLSWHPAVGRRPSRELRKELSSPLCSPCSCNGRGCLKLPAEADTARNWTATGGSRQTSQSPVNVAVASEPQGTLLRHCNPRTHCLYLSQAMLHRAPRITRAAEGRGDVGLRLRACAPKVRP